MIQKLRQLVIDMEQENVEINNKLNDDKNPLSERSHTILVHKYNYNIDMTKKLKAIIIAG